MITCSGKLIGFLYPLYLKIISILRQSCIISKMLFGLGTCHPNPRIQYWDWVTLALRKALRKVKKNDIDFLDMGCGPVAIISVYMFKKKKAKSITAVDIETCIIDSASLILKSNSIPAKVLQSDLFSNLSDRTFDIIAFNSTYIPEKWGYSFGLDKCYPLDLINPAVTWSGGVDGTKTIDRFLSKAKGHLKANGLIYLGFNSFYLKLDKIKPIYEKHGYYIIKTVKGLVGKGVVLILGRRSNESSSTF